VIDTKEDLIHAARAQGFKDGVDAGDSRTTRVGICAVAAVLLGLFGAILYSEVVSEREKTNRIQAACSGSLDQPGPAVACALVTVRTRSL